jgi:hypothetical protein
MGKKENKKCEGQDARFLSLTEPLQEQSHPFLDTAVVVMTVS